MKKILLLMRHAKSDWSSAIANDFDRPLNQRGKQDAETMGKYIQAQSWDIEKIISSPALRARHTAETILNVSGMDTKTLHFEPKLYMGVPGETLTLINSELQQCSVLMLVSHNPLLDQLVSIFWQDEALPYMSSGKLVTTANIVMLEFEIEPDSFITEQTILRKQVIRPKEFEV